MTMTVTEAIDSIDYATIHGTNFSREAILVLRDFARDSLKYAAQLGQTVEDEDELAALPVGTTVIDWQGDRMVRIARAGDDQWCGPGSITTVSLPAIVIDGPQVSA